MSLYWVTVTVHVFAAMLWLGGMFFLAAVGAPVLRRVEDERLRRDLFAGLGVRARDVGWIAIAVLLVTGTLNLWFRGVLRGDVVWSAAFWATPWGVALAWKLGSVAVMLVVQAVHDFVLGPLSSTAEPGSPRALALRRRAALFARLNALVGVVVVVAAVRLARGG
jgi:copper resistance protein D